MEPKDPVRPGPEDEAAARVYPMPGAEPAPRAHIPYVASPYAEDYVAAEAQEPAEPYEAVREVAEAWIRENQWLAAAGGFALGVVFGVLLRR